MGERPSLPRLSQRNDVSTFVLNTIRSSNWRRTSSLSRPSPVDLPTETLTHGHRKISQLALSIVQLLSLAWLPRLANVLVIAAEMLERMDPSLRSLTPNNFLTQLPRRNLNSLSRNASTRSHGILSSCPAPRTLSDSDSTSCLKLTLSNYPTRSTIT